MLKYYYRSVQKNKIEKISEAKKGSWLFSYSLSGEEIKKLVKLGFDEVLIEDALDYFEVPRFEYVNGVHYFFTRYVVNKKDGELSTAPLLIAISDLYLLTISHEKPEFLDDFLHGRKKIITTQKVKFLLIFLETLIGEYEKTLIRIRRMMLRYYGNIENISEKDIKHIVALESRLADYLSALIPTRESLHVMLRKTSNIQLHEKDVEIVEDLQQDVHQVIESAKNVSKTVQNIRSAHSDILAHKLNLTMKKLTAVTILFTIPTIVSGIFGMNTWLPFTNGPSGFLFVLLIILAISYFTLKYFKDKNWM